MVRVLTVIFPADHGKPVQGHLNMFLLETVLRKKKSSDQLFLFDFGSCIAGLGA